MLTRRDVHVDAVLKAFAMGWAAANKNHFVAGQVFPRVSVEKESDKYFEWDRSAWTRISADLRADGSPFPESSPTLSATAYQIEEYAHQTRLGDRTAKNADVDVERGLTVFSTEQVLRKLDKLFAAEMFKAGVWHASGDAAPANLWSNTALGTPMKDVLDAKNVVSTSTDGREPNVMIVNMAVWNALAAHPNFTSRGGLQFVPQANKAMVEEALGLKVIVAKAGENTAKPGDAEVQARIFGNHALLLYVDPNATIMSPTAGVTFTVGDEWAADRIYDEKIKASFYRAWTLVDFVKTSQQLGYFYSTVI